MDKLWSKLFQLKWVAIVVVFWVTLGVYLRTLTPTVPFWDSGEFIATSYILGIPHPPGTPLYVMIGRLVTLLPFATVAVRVNALSSVVSALTVAMMFIVTWKFLVRTLGRAPTRRDHMLILAGAATAAFFIAFSDSFWGNAVEAEVYGCAALTQALVVWMALRWADGLKQNKGDALLLGAVYVLALAGLGIHLGGILVAPGVLLFVLLTNRRSVLNARFLGLAALAVVVGTIGAIFLVLLSVGLINLATKKIATVFGLDTPPKAVSKIQGSQDSSRDLLFGVIALQNNLIDQADLVAGGQRKSHSLETHLRRIGQPAEAVESFGHAKSLEQTRLERRFHLGLQLRL